MLSLTQLAINSLNEFDLRQFINTFNETSEKFCYAILNSQIYVFHNGDKNEKQVRFVVDSINETDWTDFTVAETIGNMHQIIQMGNFILYRIEQSYIKSIYTHSRHAVVKIIKLAGETATIINNKFNKLQFDTTHLGALNRPTSDDFISVYRFEPEVGCQNGPDDGQKNVHTVTNTPPPVESTVPSQTPLPSGTIYIGPSQPKPPIVEPEQLSEFYMRQLKISILKVIFSANDLANNTKTIKTLHSVAPERNWKKRRRRTNKHFSSPNASQ